VVAAPAPAIWEICQVGETFPKLYTLMGPKFARLTLPL
jgi:hypothetical protein